MKRVVCLIMIASLMAALLAGCTGNGKDVVFDGISIRGKEVKLGSLEFGYSLEEVLKAEGLTEEDVLYNERDNGYASAGMYNDLFFKEFEPYGVKKAYYFNDGRLTGVSYVTRLFDVPYDEAYNLCMDAFRQVDRLLKKAEVMENGSIESLKEVGGSYLKQYILGDIEIDANLTYQDMSKADFTDINIVNFSLSIGKRSKN